VIYRSDVTNAPAVADHLAESVYVSGRRRVLSYDSDGIAIRVVANRRTEPALVDVSRSWALAYWGYPSFDGRSLSEANVRDAFARRLDCRVESALRSLGGHYQLFLWNTRSGRGLCVSDKVSTHPWYLVSFGGYSVAAPDPLCMRVLKRHGWPARVDSEAIPEYLVSGHLWGRRTFYRDCTRVGPGEWAETSPHGWVVGKTHWKLTFRPENVPRSERSARLRESIVSDFRQSLPQGRGVISLSGGLDSRALVGLARQAGLDVEAVTWVPGDEITPHGEAAVARSIAEKARVPWHPVFTDLAEFCDNLTDTVRATGGESFLGAFQEAALGRRYYDLLRDHYGYAYLLRGDEVWGWEDSASSAEDALTLCRILSLSDVAQCRRLLTSQAFRAFENVLEHERFAMVSLGQGSPRRWDDLKDSIYWRHREARMLQNMAYFRRSHLPQVAPFLMDQTLETIATLPPGDRVNKRLFTATAKRLFPDLYAVERARRQLSVAEVAVNRLVGLRELVEDVLLVAPPTELVAVLDVRATAEFVAAVFAPAQSRAAAGRFLLLHRLSDLSRSLPWFRPTVIRLLRLIGSFKYPILDVDFVFRLAVLGLALREHAASPPVD